MLPQVSRTRHRTCSGVSGPGWAGQRERPWVNGQRVCTHLWTTPRAHCPAAMAPASIRAHARVRPRDEAEATPSRQLRVQPCSPGAVLEEPGGRQDRRFRWEREAGSAASVRGPRTLNRVGESQQTGKGPSEGTGGRLPTCLRPAGKASESKFDQNISKQETLRQLLSTRPHHGEVLKGVLPAEGKGSHGCVETSAATGTGKRSCGGNR